MTDYRKREIENLEFIQTNTNLGNPSSSIKIVSMKHFFKRMIDIVGSLSCLIFSAIFIILIALAIKLTSKGPILFKQKRVGYLGYPFTLLKFRTMHHSMNENIHQEYIKLLRSENYEQNDLELYRKKIINSYTPIGRILRKISVDEIPQLFNILIGDMSLVGPETPPRL